MKEPQRSPEKPDVSLVRDTQIQSDNGLSARAQSAEIQQSLSATMAPPDSPTDPHHIAEQGVSGPGAKLPHLQRIQRAFGRYNVGGVKAHSSSASQSATESLGATAYAQGEDVAFSEDTDLHTAAHEAAHVVQQRSGVQLAGGVGKEGDAYEQHADSVADAVVRNENAEPLLAQMAGKGALEEHSGNTSKIQMHPAKTITKRLYKWVMRSSVKKQISKHVSKHGHAIAGKALHTVFKRPNKIRDMVRKTATEAIELAQKSTLKSADEVLESSGIRMFRQSAGGDKFRWIIEREFKNPIGKGGERVLKIVVDYSGRIVTAYPTRALSAIGITAAGVGVFDAKAAHAGSQIQSLVEADQKKREEDENSWGSFVVDLIMPIGLTSTPVNEGEDLFLAKERILQQVAQELINEIEQAEQRTLDSQTREELYELLRVSIGSAMIAQGAEDDEVDN